MPDKNKGSAISFGPFRLVPNSRLLEKDRTPLPIGGRALDILIVLAEHPGEVVDKRELVKRVWADVNVDEGSLRFHITALRKALGDGIGGARYILNVPGRGYCLAAPLARAASTEAPPVRPGTPSHSLPPPLARMIGRAEAIEKISSQLSAHRFVTVVGPGGIGKTSVAVAVGHGRLADFAGQVFFIDLGKLHDNTLVASTIASTLGLTISLENPTSGLLAYLHNRPMLLILDSCEHVLDALAPLAERIITEVPGAHLLATSRESLRSEGERIFRLFPLDYPPQRDDLSVDETLSYPAVQLFVERITESLGEFQLSAEDAPLVANICRRLDGIALAIELAAGRVNAYGIAGTASLLDSRFSLQWRGRRTAVPRHQTLSAALGWSYDLLPAAESATLRRLSIFVGPFTLEAAAAVASDDGLGASEAIEAIDNLVAKSLIAPSGARPLRYRLLDMTRAYAAQKLADAGEATPFLRRHAEYLRTLFDRAESETSSQLADWLSLYGAELDNVRAALDWSFSPQGDNSLGIALTAAAVTLWVRLSLFTECRERTGLALSKLDESSDGDARKRMQLLAALGWSLMYSEGRAREARPILEQTLELAEQLDEKDFRLRALWGLCIDQFNNGQIDRALEFADRFSHAAAGSADPADIMLSHRLQAVAFHYLGDQTVARLHIDRVNASLHGLTEKPKIFPLDLRASTHYFRIRILWLQGLADQAQALIARNIEEGRANGHALTFCSVLGQGACPISYLADDLDTAERYGHDLFEHCERHSVRLWRLWAKAFNAMVIAKRGDLERGLSLLREELDGAGDARFLPRFLPLLAELAAFFGEANQVHQGLKVIEETLARCMARQERWYVPELARIKGELMLRDTQQASSAGACFSEALEVAGQQGARFWELRSAISLARLWMGQGRNREAGAVLRKVYGSFSEGFDSAGMRTARRLIDQLRS